MMFSEFFLTRGFGVDTALCLKDNDDQTGVYFIFLFIFNKTFFIYIFNKGHKIYSAFVHTDEVWLMRANPNVFRLPFKAGEWWMQHRINYLFFKSIHFQYRITAIQMTAEIVFIIRTMLVFALCVFVYINIYILPVL